MILKMIPTFALLFQVAFADHSGNAERPSTHGMLLFGDHQLFVSHLPMFHKPHDKQLILKVELDLAGENLAEQIKKDKLESGADYYTIVPKPMTLGPVADGTVKEFSAQVFRGHFERGGVQLFSHVDINIQEILLNTNLVDTTQAQPAYSAFLFTDGIMQFMAHRIGGHPNFDQITKVSFADTHQKPFSKVTMEIENKSDTEPLLQPVNILLKSGSTSVPANVSTLIYTETGDLSM